ncbi:uncharacterized protein PgNI_09401 [Pyricularia grisea]|uniref:Uncharacterized protein n=1 Tax=Pyricularia grisea TaxID=148305 RepID=A0A6P8ATV0_PYRGI|nr:uncharacterized protein PgNI_09401 [Pyricularia grisea]TLD05533.1 hypothetical protein PgNI_09401 [Pyricularia grisea]
MAPDSAATSASLCGRPRHHIRAPARPEHHKHQHHHHNPRRRKIPGKFSNVEYAADGLTIQAVGDPSRESGRVTRHTQQQNRITVRRLVHFSGLGDRLRDMATRRGLASPCFSHTTIESKHLRFNTRSAVSVAIESFILSFCTIVSCMLLLNHIILGGLRASSQQLSLAS